MKERVQTTPAITRRLVVERPQHGRWLWNAATKFVQDGFFRRVLLLSSGTLASQLILISSGVLLARMYAPESFGELSLFVSTITLMAVVSAGRFEVAIPIPKERDEAIDILVLCLAMVGGTTVLACLSAWWLHRVAEAFLPTSANYSILIWFAPIGLALAGIHRTCKAWLVREGHYKRLAGGSIAQASVQAATQIGLGLLTGTGLGLVLGDLAGRTAGGVTIGAQCISTLREHLPQCRIKRLVQVARRYQRFPLVSSWAAFMNAAGNHLPHFLMLAYFDLHSVGLFALSQKIIGMPTTLLANSVASVYLRDCSKLRHEGRDAVLRLQKRTMISQLSIALFIVVVFVLPAPWYFRWVFGSQWQDAGWYAWPLSLILVPKFVASPLSVTLDVFERQGLHFLRELTRVTLVVLAFIVAGIIAATPFTAICLLSIAGCVANLIAIAIAYRVVVSLADTDESH